MKNTRPTRHLCSVAAALASAFALAPESDAGQLDRRTVWVNHARGRLATHWYPAKSPSTERVLLVPGTWCNARTVGPLASRLQQRGIDTYALDLPGRGQSKSRWPRPTTIGTDARAIGAAAAQLGSDPQCRAVHLAGHSGGGTGIAALLGLLAANKLPGLSPADIASATLLAPAGRSGALAFQRFTRRHPLVAMQVFLRPRILEKHPKVWDDMMEHAADGEATRGASSKPLEPHSAIQLLSLLLPTLPAKGNKVPLQFVAAEGDNLISLPWVKAEADAWERASDGPVTQRTIPGPHMAPIRAEQAASIIEAFVRENSRP